MGAVEPRPGITPTVSQKLGVAHETPLGRARARAPCDTVQCEPFQMANSAEVFVHPTAAHRACVAQDRRSAQAPGGALITRQFLPSQCSIRLLRANPMAQQECAEMQSTL